jgi:hypothetical protein
LFAQAVQHDYHHNQRGHLSSRGWPSWLPLVDFQTNQPRQLASTVWRFACFKILVFLYRLMLRMHLALALCVWG